VTTSRSGAQWVAREIRVDAVALERYLDAVATFDRRLREALEAAESAIAGVPVPEARSHLADVHGHLGDHLVDDGVVRDTLAAVRALRVGVYGAQVARSSASTHLADILARIEGTAGAAAVVGALGRLPDRLRGVALRAWLTTDTGVTLRTLVGSLHHAAWEQHPQVPGPQARERPDRQLAALGSALSGAFEGATPAETDELLESIGDPTTLAWLVGAGLHLPAEAAVSAFRRWYPTALTDRLRSTDPSVGLDVPHRLVAFDPRSDSAAVPERLLDLVTQAPGGPSLLVAAPHNLPADLRIALGLDRDGLPLLDLLELPVPAVDGGAAAARFLAALARKAEPAVADSAAALLLERALDPNGTVPGVLEPAASIVADHHLEDLANALGLPLHRRIGRLEVVDGVLALDREEAARLVGRALLDPVTSTVLLAPLTELLAGRAVAALGTPSERGTETGDWLRSLLAFDHAVASAAYRHDSAIRSQDPSAVAWRSVLLVVDVGTAIAAVTGHLPSALRAPVIAPLHDAARRARAAPDPAAATADAIGMGCHQVVALGLVTGRLELADPLVERLDGRFRNRTTLQPWWALTPAERAAFVHIATSHTTTFIEVGLPTPGEIAALHAESTVVAR